jgi:hypothetical protein
MKTKKTKDEWFVSHKKKTSKCHEQSNRFKKLFDAGLILDSQDTILNVGDWVKFYNEDLILEGEVVEIHSNNVITVSYDTQWDSTLRTININAKNSIKA